MSAVLVVAGVAVAAIVVAYFERKAIKAEAEKVRAVAEVKVATFEQALRIKESQVRAKISIDSNKVIADIEGWAAKEAAAPGAVIAQFEARLRQII